MIELKDIINSSYFINNNEQLKSIIEEEQTKSQKPKKATTPKPKPKPKKETPPKPKTKPRNDDIIFFVSTLIALLCIITQTLLVIFLL